MKRTAWLVAAWITVAALSTAALASGPSPQVHGGGQAVVTDPDNNSFPASFGISGGLAPDGSAGGSINFRFGPEFSAVWGAVPGVTSMHVWGNVESIAVADDDSIILAGTATEVDVLPGGAPLVFENEPFELVINAGGQGTFTWCELPVFDVEATQGTVVVR